MTSEYKFRFHKKVRESKGLVKAFWFFIAVMYTQYLTAIGEIE